MGCSMSRIDGLPAVALCRHRTKYLADALQDSYALADAHDAYLQALRTVGPAFHRFLDRTLDYQSDDDVRASPSSSSADASPRNSDAESHIKFDTESDSDEEEKDNLDRLFTDFMKSHHQPSPSRSISFSNYSRDSDRYESYVSVSKTSTPPPPPPASSSSAWDFLNFFEPYELPYHVTGKEVKVGESSEDFGRGLLKQTPNVDTLNANEERSQEKKDVKQKDDSVEKQRDARPADKETRTKQKKDFKMERRKVSVTLRELQELFEKASDSGTEVLKLLDTAKFRYYEKSSACQVSSNILQAFGPNLLGVPSRPYADKFVVRDPGPKADETLAIAGNISLTLKKLLMWEKKLFKEVRDEEKLRKIYAGKCRLMKRLEDNGGTDSRKIESTQALLRTLATRMKVAIQVMDSISATINKVRDEELWPQLKELIQRLSKMWVTMLECHSRQTCSVAEATKLHSKIIDSNQLESAIELKSSLRNLSLSFSRYVDAQRLYVKSLNSWLMQFISHGHGERADAVVPTGAPPLFGVVNGWAQTIDRLSEKEDVVEAVVGLLSSLNRVLGQHNREISQRNVHHGKMPIEPQALLSEKISLSPHLEQMFASLVSFSENSKEAYEDLCHQVGKKA